MSWKAYAVIIVLGLAITTAINVPLWRECKANGFSDYYCFWHLK